MELIVTQKQGDTQWRVTLSNAEMYEILCTQMAWRILFSSNYSQEQVVNSVIRWSHHFQEDKTPEELSKIADPFIRAVVIEAQRLNIKFKSEDES